MSAMRGCPAPGCHRSIGLEMFACREHWFSLPKEIRDEVWSSYRHRLRVAKSDDLDARRSAREAHQAAMDKATSYLEDRVRI